MESSCFWPFIFTATMPPPAVASTTVASICFCSFSCICWACFISCCRFIKLLPFRGLNLGQISAEHFQKTLHERLVFNVVHSGSVALRLFFDYKRHRNRFANQFTGNAIQYGFVLLRLKHGQLRQIGEDDLNQIPNAFDPFCLLNIHSRRRCLVFNAAVEGVLKRNGLRRRALWRLSIWLVSRQTW